MSGQTKLWDAKLEYWVKQIGCKSLLSTHAIVKITSKKTGILSILNNYCKHNKKNSCQ